MKKAAFVMLFLAGGTFLYAQDVAVDDITATIENEASAFTPVDHLSPSQVDIWWYSADTGKVMPVGVVALYKGGIYITVELMPDTTKKQETVLARFDWHTGQIVLYQTKHKGEPEYTFVRDGNGFKSTTFLGVGDVPIDPTLQERLVTMCRSALIATTNVIQAGG